MHGPRIAIWFLMMKNVLVQRPLQDELLTEKNHYERANQLFFSLLFNLAKAL